MPKGYRHTEEAKARIGAAARERKSSAIATAASVAAAAAREALKPKKKSRKVLTPEERRANNLRRATEWATKHPEQAKANKRRSYEQNRERINAAQREKNKTPERKPLARDHDIPLARGGSNYISNIAPACVPCNSSKGTLTGDEFRARRRGEGATMDPRWEQQLAAARANSPAHRARHAG